jgi:hypothetical protein
LIAKAKTTISWSDATALHTPREVASAARTARQNGATGFMPSLEAFSYVATVPEAGEPWVIGKRHHPYGFDPLGEGKMPYNTLPVRVQRFAYRTFSHDPNLDYAEFQQQLAENFFGKNAPPTAAADILELQRIWSFDSDWYWPTPLLDPEFLAAHAEHLKWSKEKLKQYDDNLASLRQIATRYANATDPTSREIHDLAATIAARWKATGHVPSNVARPSATATR